MAEHIQPQYSKATRGFFLFMTLVMVLGYPLLLLTGLPSFQQLFVGGGTGTGAVSKRVSDAHDVVIARDCGDSAKAPKGSDLKASKRRSRSSAAATSRSLPARRRTRPPACFRRTRRRTSPSRSSRSSCCTRSIRRTRNPGRSSRAPTPTRASSTWRCPCTGSSRRTTPAMPTRSTRSRASRSRPRKDDLAILTYQKFLKLAPEDSRAEGATAAIEEIRNPQQQNPSGLDLSSAAQ